MAYNAEAVPMEQVADSALSMVLDEENNRVLTFERDMLDEIREKAIERIRRYQEAIAK